MADIIERKYYQDTTGQVYEASLYYDKSDKWSRFPRGYYVRVEPVEVWLDREYVGTHYHGANADYLFSLAEEVDRKNKKAEALARDCYYHKINEYFESRDKVARLVTLDEILK